MSRRHVNPMLDFDLNLAPIIDCFVVLITFMLASASFLSISIFDAGFTPAEAVGDPNPPEITVTMTITAKEKYVIEVDGKSKSKEAYASPAEAGDALKVIKEKYPAVDSITMNADDSVPYEQVVRTMEKVRPVMPAIVLGGF